MLFYTYAKHFDLHLGLKYAALPQLFIKTNIKMSLHVRPSVD